MAASEAIPAIAAIRSATVAKPISPVPPDSHVRTRTNALCSGDTAPTGDNQPTDDDIPSATVAAASSPETARPTLPSHAANAWLASPMDYVADIKKYTDSVDEDVVASMEKTYRLVLSQADSATPTGRRRPRPARARS